METTLTRGCAPRQRCRRHRTCDACARIRQARIADTAEAILRGHLQLQLIVLKPMDGIGATLKRAIQQCIRTNHLTAGIWTIEQGEKVGTLHANILTHSACTKSQTGISTHTEPIRTNVRAVAAYISKKSQAPDPAHWTGRTYASWGHISHALHDPQMPAIIGGAIIEQSIALAQKAPPPAVPAPQASPRMELSIDQYREIAARHLPHLAAMSDSFKRR